MGAPDEEEEEGNEALCCTGVALGFCGDTLGFTGDAPGFCGDSGAPNLARFALSFGADSAGRLFDVVGTGCGRAGAVREAEMCRVRIEES